MFYLVDVAKCGKNNHMHWFKMCPVSFITHVARKVTEFQLHNLIASLACYIIVCDPRCQRNEANEIQVCRLSMGLEKLKFDKIISI